MTDLNKMTIEELIEIYEASIAINNPIHYVCNDGEIVMAEPGK